MSVGEHGLEAIRRSAEEQFPPSKIEYVLKVKVKNVSGEEIPISGSFVFSGLSQEIKITTLEITDTAAAIPTTNLTNRNSISIHNLSATEILYIGPSNVASGRTVGGNGGWEVLPGEALNFDIANDVTIYGIAESGKTILVKVLEMA